MSRIAVAAVAVLVVGVLLVLDAGALTGTVTELPPPVQAGDILPEDINDAGEVAGSATAPGEPNSVFRRAADGTYTDLGPGQPFAMNSAGDIVGRRSTATLWPAGGGEVDLGTLPPDNDSLAFDINDSGVIVGYSFGGSIRSWVRYPDDGVLVPMFEPGDESMATQINNAGVATGTGFTWTAAGGKEVLPIPPGGTRPLVPEDINDAGQIAGNVEKAGSPPYRYRAYVWDPVDGYVELTVAGYETAFVTSLNESGLAVGYVNNDGVAPRMAAWDLANGETVVFPPPPGVVFPVPDQPEDGLTRNALTAVNNHGLAVGLTSEADPDPIVRRAWLYQITRTPAPPGPPAAPPAAPVPLEPAFTG